MESSRGNLNDVFVSFRGEDTRHSFIDHLFGALRRNNISVFREDIDIRVGESIADKYLHAIEGSQVFIVVISKNYVSSKWCLSELVKILECSEKYGKRVLPVFYDVDPSDVRHLTGSYAKAFAKYEHQFGISETVKQWKTALRQVAEFAGWVLHHKPEYALIEKIVEQVINILGRKISNIIQSSISCSDLMESTRDNLNDVFVSFCGEDTGHSFTDHLFGALRRNNISVFREDTDLNRRGESIADKYLHAIEGSQVFIVVFSKNYASSKWCLTELVKIHECCKKFGKRILPVFYDVAPSEVRMQRGSYAEAFAKYKSEIGFSATVKLWETALEQVSSFNGLDLRHKPEYALIEKIVEQVINILGRKISSVPDDLGRKDSHIEELEKCLLLDSVNDVRAVGICGMDGIGKTTLATILYEKISHQFDACCFIVDVSKTYEQYGPIGVQKEILLQTLGKEYLYDETDSAQSRLSQFRALIILDNVDHSDQLEKLEVTHKSLAPGSKIIIICREARILQKYGVDTVYQVPLAIEVLGSSLSGQSVSESKFELNKLGESPNKDSMDKLQFSFNRLEEREKEIFLHIACFFNQREKDYVKNVLNCCGFDADFGLDVLSDKSFISISDESKIIMHALLEELGRKIVHEKSRKWSKLWLHEQFSNVVLENMENNVDAVVLYGSEREKGKLMAEILSKLNSLRLLILKEVKFFGSLNCLSNELRYVEWDEYPFLYLPSSFQPNQLVALILVDSSIQQLWFDTEKLPNLRTLDLSYSENLTKIPDFGEFPNLKRLNLEGCVKLVQIDSSIGLLRELVFLNLKNCENLICIPNEISGLTALKYLNLCGCSKAFNNPKAREDFSSCVLPSLPSFSCLSELDISFCRLSQIPDALGCLTWLERLNLRGNNFVTLPSLQDLSKLEYLNLEHCKQLTSLPELPLPAAIKKDKLKRVGMYIFNCPELGEREHCTSMAFSWMTNFIQANQNSCASFDQIDIVIPGSEIPSWFNNWKMGRSISIDPSPIVYDYNIIGIACCAIFSVEPFDPTKTRYEWGPVVRLGFKSSNAANSNYVVIPVTLYRHLVMVKSNHMWLIYFDRELFFSFLRSIHDTLWELDHIVMEASVTNGQGLHLEVKNCGYSWVFKQDQQPSESLNKDVLQNEETLVLQSTTHMVIEDEAQPQQQAQ